MSERPRHRPRLYQPELTHGQVPPVMPTKVGIHDLPFARCKVVDALSSQTKCNTIVVRWCTADESGITLLGIGVQL